MNTHFRTPDLPITTQAAEGLMRRRWSVAEIDAAVAAGVILENERFELIRGDAVPLPLRGLRHELVRSALTLVWARRLADTYRLAPATTFRLSEDTFLEADMLFYRK